MAIVVRLTWAEGVWRFFRAATALLASLFLTLPTAFYARRYIHTKTSPALEWVATAGDIVTACMLIVGYVGFIIALWQAKGATIADQVNVAELMRALKRERLGHEPLVDSLSPTAVSGGTAGRSVHIRDAEEDCAVCLEPKSSHIEAGYHVLACGHSFHAHCVDTWW
eukprot:CAMPEP_0170275012 /NCGR_PEP_ID=MMETSP0116_2-20130129/37481_1 /TAXON_ID=400756 /ORGANISM="Durinskia baltica, Strain CSIRO CS-38" /LENGTH=166 /DNA_ID=CAMNT_0010526265 /DNA_START=52 /DNA_END=549 /DNA_ORIENTATION=+